MAKMTVYHGGYKPVKKLESKLEEIRKILERVSIVQS